MLKSLYRMAAPLFLAAIAAMALHACATVPMPGEEIFIKTDPSHEVRNGFASVYFYRPEQYQGGSVRYLIHDGDKVIGALMSNSAFVYEATPGRHLFWAENEIVSRVVIDCEADTEYFIEGDTTVGKMMGNPELSRMWPNTAKKRIKSIPFYTFDWNAKPKNNDPMR
ncbi:MAG: hypothetical protein ABIL58_20145 [Pseudomonadota bacterium]